MNIQTLIEQIQPYFTFETSRSSGKGGQHVNKTESRVTLVWNVEESALEEELLAKLKEVKHHYIDYPIVRVSSQKTRSQLKNKEDTLAKLKAFLERVLREEKERKETKVPKAVKAKRLENKKKQSTVKSTRKKIDPRDL